MQPVKSVLVTAAAAALLAGSVGIAEAANGAHILTVQLPDGSVEQIRYTGDVAPEVSIEPGWAGIDAFAPMPAFFGPDFYDMQQISARIDRQLKAMQRHFRSMQMQAFGNSNQPIEAALKNVPPGTTSYSMVSVSNGNGFCARSVQIVKPASGKPQVEQHTSGNCSGMNAGPVPGNGGLSPDDNSNLTTINSPADHPNGRLHEINAIRDVN